MQFTTENEPDLTLPDESFHRARLQEIKLRTFTFTDRNSKEEKEGKTLEWWWEITSTKYGAEYVGRKVKGECNPKLSNRGDNRFRIWSEALLQREIPVGMSIDTDDLVGLEGEILVGLRPDRRDPNKMWEYVSNVLPVDGSNQIEPPF